MTCHAASLPTLEALSDYVRTMLCERDHLDPAQTPFFRTPMIRGGRPWGYLFHVEGPRLLKASAVWAAESDAIVFYDSQGQKVNEVRLTDAPTLPDIRAVGGRPRAPRPVRKSA